MPEEQSPQMLDGIAIAQEIQNYLSEKGIKQAWLTRKFGRHRSWFNQVLSGNIAMTETLLKQFEEILETRFSELQTENNGQEI